MNDAPQTKRSGVGAAWLAARKAALCLLVAAATMLPMPPAVSAASPRAHTSAGSQLKQTLRLGPEPARWNGTSDADGDVEIGAVDAAAIARAIEINSDEARAGSADGKSSEPEIYGAVLGQQLRPNGGQLSSGVAAGLLLAVCSGSVLVVARRRYHRSEVR